MAGDEEAPPPATFMSDNNQMNPENAIRILLATDNHIGYAERDPVRGRDSINTFHEILELAKQNDVDFLLLAGDLFHENKPSRPALYQTTAALRQWCMGDKPISFSMVSDAGMGIGRNYDFPLINYEDQNMNIGLPVFSIHGNHDDPQGAGSEGALCALDLLSASGLINYFGRQELPGDAVNDEEAREGGIQVKPLLIQKGTTKLAMYGIGNMRDERFYAEMRRNRISLFKPTETPEEWFNLLLIHQNRATHNPKSSVPEDGFGDDVDLIVWGHEHDCRIMPEPITGKNYSIMQPGSSIATSLAEGEATQKKVALLTIQNRGYSVTPVPLRTVRPFVIDEVNLNDAKEEGVDLSTRVNVTKFLKGKVNELIERAEKEWDDLHPAAEAGDEEQEEVPRMLPLVRLRVFYEGSFETGNPQRFGQEFASRVANPKDIIAFTRKKRAEARSKVSIDQPVADDRMDTDELEDNGSGLNRIKVETFVREYLQAQQLEIIAENGMARAVDDFVEKDDTTAIKDFVKKQLSERRLTLVADNKKKPDPDESSMQVEDEEEALNSEDDLNNKITAAKLKDVEEIEQGKSRKGKGKAAAKGKGKAQDEDEEDDSEFGMDEEPPAKKGKAPAKGKGKGKEKELFRDESDSEASVASSKASKKPAAKKAAAKKTTAKSTQSQLEFAPARKTGARGAATKAEKAVQNLSSDGEDDADKFQDSDDDDRPKKKQATRKK